MNARTLLAAGLLPLAAACVATKQDIEELRLDMAAQRAQQDSLFRVLVARTEAMLDSLSDQNVRLRIEGHADQRGSTEYNLALGQRRAEAVRAFLANYGIDPDRFTTVSYGKERPLVEGEDEEAWSRNRRAEFGIIGGQVTVVPEELR